MIEIRTTNPENPRHITRWNKTMPETVECGICHQDLIDSYNENDPVDKLQLRIELTKAEMESDVPEGWPESIIVENETERQKTFVEYVGKNIQWSLDGTKANIPCSYRCINGCRMTDVRWEESKLWMDKFGIERMLTLSEAQVLRDSSEYTSK